MEYHQIKTFSGVSTRLESTDQNRGTLRRAEGVMMAPNGGISSPLSWQSLWGITSIDTLVTSAMSAKTTGFGYFLTLTKQGNTILIFYEKGAGLRGLWWVGQSWANPISTVSGSVTVTEVGSEAVDLSGVDKTYYGSWINDDLWLGHGTRKNFIWKSETGLVTELGLAAPDNLHDPGKEQFPPCKSFVQSSSGVVWGAGHTAGTYPATRVWMTNPPNSQYPDLERIYNLEQSYVDISRADASEIKGLSVWQTYIVVHTDRRPWVVQNIGSTSDGYLAQQNATPLSVSAPNSNCTRDLTGTGEFWFGEDREIYKDEAIRASSPDKDYWNQRDITTSLADGIWNERMSLDASTAHSFFDRVNGRFYVFAPLKAGADPYAPDYAAYGLYAWCEESRGLSGPMVYPSAFASTTGRETLNRLNRVIVATTQGELLFADLDEVREREEFEVEDYDAADDETFAVEALTAESGSVQSPYAWLQSTADRDNDGALYQFDTTAHALFARFARTTFDDTAPDPVFSPQAVQTLQWQNATVARLEFAAEDFGSPSIEKVFQEIRLTWQRDSKAYVGVFVRTDYGQSDGYWIGNPWPGEEQLIGINVRGRRLQVTVLAVFSNHPGSKAMLRDLTVGYLPSVTAHG